MSKLNISMFINRRFGSFVELLNINTIHVVGCQFLHKTYQLDVDATDQVTLSGQLISQAIESVSLLADAPSLVKPVELMLEFARQMEAQGAISGNLTTASEPTFIIGAKHSPDSSSYVGGLVIGTNGYLAEAISGNPTEIITFNDSNLTTSIPFTPFIEVYGNGMVQYDGAYLHFNDQLQRAIFSEHKSS